MSASHLKSFLLSSLSIPYHLNTFALLYNFSWGHINIPPSTLVKCLIAWKLKVAKLPWDPIGLPLYFETVQGCSDHIDQNIDALKEYGMSVYPTAHTVKTIYCLQRERNIDKNEV